MFWRYPCNVSTVHHRGLPGPRETPPCLVRGTVSLLGHEAGLSGVWGRGGEASSAHQEEPGSLRKGRPEVCHEGQTPRPSLGLVWHLWLRSSLDPDPAVNPRWHASPVGQVRPQGPRLALGGSSAGPSSVCLHGDADECAEERGAAGTCEGKCAWKKGPPQRLASLRGQNSAPGFYLTSQKCYLWSRRRVSSMLSTSAVSSQKTTVAKGQATYRCKAGSGVGGVGQHPGEGDARLDEMGMAWRGPSVPEGGTRATLRITFPGTEGELGHTSLG